MPLHAYPLFSYFVFKGTIDPTKYNKQPIIDVVERNYQINPNRNEWDTESSMHHCYKDWENPNFEKIPETAGLSRLYKEFFQNAFKEFIFKTNGGFQFYIANVTGTKEGQFMRKHHHNPAFYSAIHYVQLAQEHSRTVFCNPASDEEKLADYTMELVSANLHHQALINSSFFKTWTFDIQEDDILLFPSFLEHYIPETPPTDKLRVSIALNVFLDGMPVTK